MDYLGPLYRRPVPYIFSDAQIADLLSATHILTPKCGLRPQTYYTLFGLLACTGLRISEALNLNAEDVDLESKSLFVAGTKGVCAERVLPITRSTADALGHYLERRARHHTLRRSNALFLTQQRGNRLEYQWVMKTFLELRKHLHWESVVPRPRIHSLRHTFAVKQLLRWSRVGNVQSHILLLSQYMGHSGVESTYWYFTAVPALMRIAVRRLHRYATAFEDRP
jgi:integrase